MNKTFLFKKQLQEGLAHCDQNCEECTADCPMLNVLQIFSGKWNTRVLILLCTADTMRFGELKRKIPKITNTMLTSTLRNLEELGVVDRKQFNEIPPHVEYSLTKSGKALLPIFSDILTWAEKYRK